MLLAAHSHCLPVCMFIPRLARYCLDCWGHHAAVGLKSASSYRIWIVCLNLSAGSPATAGTAGFKI